MRSQHPVDMPMSRAHHERRFSVDSFHTGCLISMRFLLLLVCISLTVGCEKKKAEQSSAAVTPKSAPSQTSQVTATTQSEPSAADAEDKVKAPDEPEKKVVGEPRNLDREYDRDTLEKAYVEIDCARLKNDPAKLEAVFHKYGFNHPKLWTSAWAKASKDKEWVAKLVLAAHTACPRPSGKNAETEPKSP